MAVDRRNIPLSKISVAAPCEAEWRFMYGDDRTRFCGRCSQNVYNLSSMTREEVEDLIRRTDGQLCVRFTDDRDGTILTRNCPVGLRAIKERLTGTSAAIIAGLLTVLASLIPLWRRASVNEPFDAFPGTMGHWHWKMSASPPEARVSTIPRTCGQAKRSVCSRKSDPSGYARNRLERNQ